TRNAHNKEKTQMFRLIEAFNEGLHTRHRLHYGRGHRLLNPRRRNSSNSRARLRLEPGMVSFKLSGRSPAAVLLLSAMLLGLGFPRATGAQVLYGSLTGNVTDQSGAIVTDAKVEVLNVATNISTTVTTDERGSYLVSELQPGIYKVTISAGSFKTVEQTDVRVDANTVRRVDVQLQAAAVSETVTVSAQNAPLQTDRADLNQTQSARQINNL